MARKGGPDSRAYNPAGGGPHKGNRNGRKQGTSGATGKRNANQESCCPMVAAVRSAKDGKWRLARRYAAWSLRLIAERSRHALARA